MLPSPLPIVNNTQRAARDRTTVDSMLLPDFTRDRTLRRDVEDYLIRLIRAGALRPGERINEAEIARRLDVSRSPVHDAVVRLTKDGLLVYTPRRGVRVAEFSPRSLEELVEMRALLEGFAARRASTSLTPADVAHLQILIDEGAEAGRAGDWLALTEKDVEFHRYLVGIADHGVLAELWERLNVLGAKLVLGPGPDVDSIWGSSGEDRLASFIRDQRALLEAIRSGDPTRAESTARAHIQATTRPIASDADGG
jgi:DNA-binding GntR family transcriptional regulator